MRQDHLRDMLHVLEAGVGPTARSDVVARWMAMLHHDGDVACALGLWSAVRSRDEAASPDYLGANLLHPWVADLMARGSLDDAVATCRAYQASMIGNVTVNEVCAHADREKARAFLAGGAIAEGVDLFERVPVAHPLAAPSSEGTDTIAAVWAEVSAEYGDARYRAILDRVDRFAKLTAGIATAATEEARRIQPWAMFGCIIDLSNADHLAAVGMRDARARARPGNLLVPLADLYLSNALQVVSDGARTVETIADAVAVGCVAVDSVPCAAFAALVGVGAHAVAAVADGVTAVLNCMPHLDDPGCGEAMRTFVGDLGLPHLPRVRDADRQVERKAAHPDEPQRSARVT